MTRPLTSLGELAYQQFSQYVPPSSTLCAPLRVAPWAELTPELRQQWEQAARQTLQTTHPDRTPPTPTEPHPSQAEVDAKRAEIRAWWDEIVRRPDGTLDEDLVYQELETFSFLLDQVPRVYDEVTGGRIRKVSTSAFEVIHQAADAMNHTVDTYQLEVLFDLAEWNGDEDDALFQQLVQVAQDQNLGDFRILWAEEKARRAKLTALAVDVTSPP